VSKKDRYKKLGNWGAGREVFRTRAYGHVEKGKGCPAYLLSRQGEKPRETQNSERGLKRWAWEKELVKKKNLHKKRGRGVLEKVLPSGGGAPFILETTQVRTTTRSRSTIKPLCRRAKKRGEKKGIGRITKKKRTGSSRPRFFSGTSEGVEKGGEKKRRRHEWREGKKVRCLNPRVRLDRKSPEGRA